MMHPVVKQFWEESERGWGVRPDGYTLHLTEADRVKFIKAFEASQPDAVPDEYSRPSGSPTVTDVSDAVYKELQRAKRKHGIWKR